MASLIRYGLIEFIVTAKKLQFFTSGLVAGCVGFAKLFVCATQPSDSELRLEDFAGAVPSSPAYACAVFYPGSHTTFPFEFFLFVVRSLLLWGAFVLLWHYDALVEGGRVALRALRGQQKLRHEVQRFVRFVRFVRDSSRASPAEASSRGASRAAWAPQHATAARQCSPRRPPPPQERRGQHGLPSMQPPHASAHHGALLPTGASRAALAPHDHRAARAQLVALARHLLARCSQPLPGAPMVGRAVGQMARSAARVHVCATLHQPSTHIPVCHRHASQGVA